MLTIALSKGRLLKDFIAFLERNNNPIWAEALHQRERKLQITVKDIKFILVKGKRNIQIKMTFICHLFYSK